jgi:hypothetical protein
MAWGEAFHQYCTVLYSNLAADMREGRVPP